MKQILTENSSFVQLIQNDNNQDILYYTDDHKEKIIPLKQEKGSDMKIYMEEPQR